jgi:hypothetical protein
MTQAILGPGEALAQIRYWPLGALMMADRPRSLPQRHEPQLEVVRNRHQSALPSLGLARRHGDEAAIQINLAPVEPLQFGGSQARKCTNGQIESTRSKTNRRVTLLTNYFQGTTRKMTRSLAACFPHPLVHVGVGATAMKSNLYWVKVGFIIGLGFLRVTILRVTTYPNNGLPKLKGMRKWAELAPANSHWLLRKNAVLSEHGDSSP